MKIISFIAVCCLFISFACNNSINNTEIISEGDKLIYTKVDSLMDLMTLEEKVGQMLNLGLGALLEGEFFAARDTIVFDTAKVNRLIVKYGAGSIQNYAGFPISPEYWREIIGYIQKVALEDTRLGIPILYGMDGVHGATYTEGSIMTPHQINIAATFNANYAKKLGELTAYELKAGAQPWNFSPVLDVARNPYWGRIAESFGEDPYLVTTLGTKMMQGMQGNNPAAPTKAVACAKHFLGYGATYCGKDRSPVILSESYMRQYLLPPFEAAIDNGLLSIMIFSGSINGVPSHADHNLLTNLLKKELNFKGVLITDWGDIDNLYLGHKVAANEREAVKMSVLAGVDICMEPYDESFAVLLVDLVNSGEVPLSRINDAVRRILYVKFKSGVFNTPYFDNYQYNDFGSAQSDSINHQMACESITLLKNHQSILPLKKDTKVLVTGAAANSINYLNGAWSRSWSGEDTRFNDLDKLTILDAIKTKVDAENVMYNPGTTDSENIDIEQAVHNAAKADVVVVCVGEKPATEMFSNADELELPPIQQKLVKRLSETSKPVILVMVQGRPRIIRSIEPMVNAIVMAFLPGNEGGRAIADIIYGDHNPSGKLPYTYPKYTGSLMPYDFHESFGLKDLSPQYEFGYGLSYTKFKYSELEISSDSISLSDSIEISIELTNTGKVTGKEVVMLFVSDEVASVAPPVKQLKRFEKIELQPGERQKLNFTLTTNDLWFVNQQNKWVTEPGYFTVMVGNQKGRFYLNNNQ
jgi:beta-glucosidase